MSQVAKIIVNTSNLSLGLAQSMLKDVQALRFARLSCPGGQTVNSNHPAFIYGHLSTYPNQMMTMLGKDTTEVANPDGFADLFDAGVECRDDPDGTIYPPMEEIMSHFSKAHKAIIAVAAELTDEELTRENPTEGRFREMCPTMGDVLIFMLNAHIMLHLGQMSAWRRCEGLGSAM